MTRVVLNADDFGLAPAHTRRVTALRATKLLSDVSLLANGTSFDEAALGLRDAGVFEAGVHLCLTGGEDLEPSRYGAPADPKTEPADPKRDALELALVATARERDLPVLGICRGFQVINVAYGGSLVQHVDGHREANGPIVPHTVIPVEGSKLAGACGAAPYSVNARHHQAVTERSLAPGLVPTAHIDGFVEAFEDPARRWLVAVQWHPERAADPDMSAAGTHIFRAFADAARYLPVRAR